MVYEHLQRLPNTPFYITPDSPADPRDCARYPDSPYCGGRPLSLRPVALRPQIVKDECATGIRLRPVLGFVKLPPVEILAINPKCRAEPPPPPPPPPTPYSSAPYRVKHCKDGFFVYCDYWEGNLVPLEQWADLNNQRELSGYPERLATCEFFASGRNPDGEIEQEPQIVPDPVRETTRAVYLCQGQVSNETCSIWGERPIKLNFGFKGIVTYPKPKEGATYACSAGAYYWEFFDHDFPECEGPEPPPPPPPPPPPRKCDCMGCCPPSPNQEKNDRDLEEIKRLLKLLVKRVGEPQKVVLFDEDPNKPGRQKKTVKKETLFDAVKLATQRCEIIAQIVGIEAFPVDVPATVIAPEKSGVWAKIFAFIDGKKRRKLKSLVEMLAWQAEQDAAVLGKWHQSIDIEDGDALKEGEQPQKIVLPNVAETLKEQILLLSNLIQAQGLTLDIAIKSLHESSATKLEVAKTLVVVKDIQEYLDYDTEQKTFKVPIQISVPDPTATEADRANLSRYLEPSETQIVSDEWMGRDSFQEALTDLRNAASMIRASLSNKVGG